MAVTLTEAHRLAQARLGAQTVRQMHAVWAVLNPKDLDGSFEDWLVVVEPLIQANRQSSIAIAAAYLTAARTVALGPDGHFTATLARAGNANAIRTSMLVTGPASIRAALARGVPLTRAVDVAQARSSAAAMRHALNGGRETITRTVRRDPRILGYQRITSAKPCSFCSMLADRGAVYGEESAEFKAHDGCSCSAQPVFR